MTTFKRKEFRGAFKLAEQFREKTPTRAKRVNYSIPSVLMVMGHVEFIGYRTTHGNELVLYKHDFAPGSRPQLAAGPKRNQLFLIGGRYRVTDRGIVDLDPKGREIDDDSERFVNSRKLVTPKDREAYRGYLIRKNLSTDDTWIEKDGYLIGHVPASVPVSDRFARAKQEIDALID